MPCRLIVNADDFGLTLGINRAVEELHGAGALSSATLIAGSSAFEDAVQVALRNPQLGVGCHLVFVDGTPVSPPETIPSLLGNDGKSFRASYPDFVQAVLRGSILASDIAREALAQIGRLQAAGVAVTHVDSHKHTHLLPSVARPALAAAVRAGVKAFRFPFEPKWSRKQAAGVPLMRRLSQAGLGLFETGFRTCAFLEHGERTTDGTLGIAATGTLNAEVLRATLKAMWKRPQEEVYELCCHPGYDDVDLRGQRTRLIESREEELSALLETVPELSGTANTLRLIHYGELSGLSGKSGESR